MGKLGIQGSLLTNVIETNQSTKEWHKSINNRSIEKWMTGNGATDELSTEVWRRINGEEADKRVFVRKLGVVRKQGVTKEKGSEI